MSNNFIIAILVYSVNDARPIYFWILKYVNLSPLFNPKRVEILVSGLIIILC